MVLGLDQLGHPLTDRQHQVQRGGGDPDHGLDPLTGAHLVGRQGSHGRETSSSYTEGMSSEDPFGGLFGDPEELRRRMAELADQMQGAQK